MSDKSENPAIFVLSKLSAHRSHPFCITPDAPEAAAMAEELDVLALRKLRLEGALHPDGKDNWRLEAHLGATVVQACVVSLEPVTTRLEEDVVRKYQKDFPGINPEDEEIEMPDDDNIDPLPVEVNLTEVLKEALALALPPYPRAKDSKPGATQFAPPGVPPMSDADAKPFAALAALKSKMADDE